MSTRNSLLFSVLALASGLVLAPFQGRAQNLVVDPGFENWNWTPGVPLSASNMMAPLNPGWYVVNGSPDCTHLLNTAGNVPGWLNPSCPVGNGQIQCGTPHTGSGVLGVYKANGVAGTKEWAGTQLSSPMVPGQSYRIAFWIQNKEDNPAFIMETNFWGMFFSTTAMPSINVNNAWFAGMTSEFVTCTQMIAGSQWHYLEWCYVPQQAYTHIYLGYVGDPISSTTNIWSNSPSVGFYAWIDDVVVEAINPTLSVIGDQTLCSGDSVQLWASSSMAISWDGGQTTDTAIWVSPTTTTTYYVQSVAQGSCQLIDSVEVTVMNCNCTITLQNSIVGVDDTGCPDASCNGTAQVTPLNGAAPYTYSWNDPSAQTTATAIGLCAGAYDCFVLDNDGCMDTVSVTLTGPQFPTLSTAVTDASCQGFADGAIDLTVGGGTGPFSYLWSNAAVTEDLNGIVGGNYDVQVTDGIGCVHMDTTVVGPGPAPTPANIANAGPFCTDDAPVALTATPNGGSWSGSGVDPVTGVFDPAMGVGTYLVYYTLPTACSTPDSLSISVEAVPEADFTASPTSGCVPLDVLFTPTNVQAGQQCAWDLGDGSTSAQAAPFTYGYTLAGTYDVSLTVTSPAGCSATVTMPGLVSANPLPAVAFDMAFPSGAFPDQPVEFSDASPGNNVSWIWSFGDGTGDQGQQVSHVYTEAGFYDVLLTVTSDSGCVSTAEQLVTITAETQVFMPNAFSPDGDGENEMLAPVLQGVALDHYELLVVDRWGQLLFHATDMTKSWDGTFNNGGVPVPVGVYVWKLTARSAYTGERVDRNGHVMLLR